MVVWRRYRKYGENRKVVKSSRNTWLCGDLPKEVFLIFGEKGSRNTWLCGDSKDVQPLLCLLVTFKKYMVVWRP